MNILIVAALEDFGGVEIEVDLLMKLGAFYAHNVHVVSLKYISKKSFIHREAKKFPNIKISSTSEYFSKTFLGRLFTFLVFFKKIVFLHSFKLRDREAFGFRFAEKFKETFWTKLEGKEIIKWSDIILIVGQPINNFNSLLIEGKNNNKKIYLRLAGTVFNSHPQNRFYNVFIENINQLDAIIVHSKYNANLVKSILKYKGIIFIIDQCTIEENVLMSIRRSEKYEDNMIKFGTISRLTPEKCIGDIIMAFSKLIEDKNKISAQLYIAGSGPLEVQLKQMVEDLNLSHYVFFLGYIEGLEKIKFFTEIDIFIVSSKMETGPIAGIEAMAAGLPIISTRVGAMQERLDASPLSYFYSAGEIDELYNLMQQILNEDKNNLKKLGSHLRDKYLKSYSKDAILSQYRKVLFDLNEEKVLMLCV